jgi:hypothetical protein
MDRRNGLDTEAKPATNTALNPYKQAIFAHGRVITGLLVHHGIGGMLSGPDTNFQARLKMSTNLKVALSAVALAALVAAPAAAKSRTQQHTGQTPTYGNTVINDGRVVGADPDAFIRREIRRDHDFYSLGD